ncbi:hypothetical protein H0A64_03070 [Alcaligenaceae bacterium]|nr:hypothetical protein [Alcaligenaceae bacterium]
MDHFHRINISLPRVEQSGVALLKRAMKELYASSAGSVHGIKILKRTSDGAVLSLGRNAFHLEYDCIQILSFPTILFGRPFLIPASKVVNLEIVNRENGVFLTAISVSSQTFDVKRLKIENRRFYEHGNDLERMRLNGNQGQGARFVSGGIPSLGKR